MAIIEKQKLLGRPNKNILTSKGLFTIIRTYYCIRMRALIKDSLLRDHQLTHPFS